MATVTGYALRLPASIMSELKKEAEMEGTSINQFITVAVARRLAELRTVRYFERRAAKADPEEFKRILATTGTLPPRELDEIPEGWLDEASPERDSASACKP
jgi:hypothetical protein